MAITGKRTEKRLIDLKRFIEDQKKHAEKLGKLDLWLRDQELLSGIQQRLLSSHLEELYSLRDNLPGFSHHFGSYCLNTKRLDELLELLYVSVQEDILDTRKEV